MMLPQLPRVRAFPRRLFVVLSFAALLASSGCNVPIGSGDQVRSVRDLIRDSDAAMAATQSYRADGSVGFDVNVLPSVAHVTGHADVVKPDSYLLVKAGSHEERSLVRNRQSYSWDNGTRRWVVSGGVPASGQLSAGAQTGLLLALETVGDFSSLSSDRNGTELLRYRLQVDRVHQLTSTILGIVVPGAGGILDFAKLSGNVDFDFYLDRTSHRIDEIVVAGDVRAINIPVKIGGSIKYSDYNSSDITLPDPNTAGALSRPLSQRIPLIAALAIVPTEG